MEDIAQIEIPGISSLSVESRLAGKVKKEPVLVIMGNPPYSGSSANKNDWTEKLLKEELDGAQSYFRVNGEPLGEKNSKMLQDDYVKFLRFAQWKIQKEGKGILAMITNHAYLDNPTFRGMRQSLMKTFDEIHILDLHGNILKRETTIEGGKDENVFDIRVGVAIAIFIKHNTLSVGPYLINHSDLWGSRAYKYNYLNNNSVLTTNWFKITPSPKFYFFLRRDIVDEKKYYSFPSVTDIFTLQSSGIKTHRDSFVYDFDKNCLLQRIRQFGDLTFPNDVICNSYDINYSDPENLTKKRRAISTIDDFDLFIKNCTYRPFDDRFIFYHQHIIDRPRNEVMIHMLNENLGLTIGRQGQVVGKEKSWNLAFVSDKIIDVNLYRRGGAVLLPLNIYQDNFQRDLFNQTGSSKVSNILDLFSSKIINTYRQSVTPELIMSYIYGVFYSNTYRLLYSDFLANDFPRIPITAKHDIFQILASFGQRLIAIHLLKSLELDQTTVKYQGQGDYNTIERPKYNANENRVYINPTLYFEGVDPEVWEYQIGGYQVMDKYLKDRKGRKMDDPRHYIRIATALAKTIEIQAEIDEIYPEVEKDVIEF